MDTKNPIRWAAPRPPADAPVTRHASQRDELLQVALDFIGTLTGMSPPPIETAPPEVFGPFYAFVDRVQAITAPQAQADAPVVLPEPVAAQSRFTDTPSGTWDSCSVEHARSFGGAGYEVRYLYTEQQVRAMLALSVWHHRNPNCITCNDHGAVGNILTAEPCPDCTPPQALADAPIGAGVQRDAERYRWLRNEETGWYVGPSYSTYNDNVCDGEYHNFFGVELDKAIDAARAAQGGA